MKRLVAIAAGSALGLTLLMAPACEEDDNGGPAVARPDGGAGGTGAGGTGAGGTGAGGSGGTGADAAGADAPVAGQAQVLGVMAEVNAGEVMLGVLARTRAQRQPVLAFAEMMVTDHTAAAARVVSLAAQLNVPITDSPLRVMLRTETMATRDRLMNLQDVAAFEAAYIQSQVMMHAMVVSIIDQQLLPEATAGELRAELVGMRSTVSMHLMQAQALQSSADAGAPDAP